MRIVPRLFTSLFIASAPAFAAAPAVHWDVVTPTSSGQLVAEGADTAATDGNGDLYVVATLSDGARSCIVTQRLLSTSGVVAWRREACEANGAHAVALALDGAGNVVVAGNALGTFRLLKYSGATGAILWEQRFAGGGLEKAHAMKAAATGDVLLMGQSSTPSSEIWVAKHRGADGSLAWQQPIDAGAEVTPAGLAVDASGNAFVAGSYRSSRGDQDWHLARLAGSSGAVVWRKIYDTGGNDTASALTVDAAGDVVVAGVSGGVIRTVRSASATGRTLWEAGDGAAGGQASAIRADASGNVFVTGSAAGGMRTLKYRADGTVAWSVTEPGGSARALAVDAEGSVVVTGAAGGLRTVKYAGDGSLAWSASLPSNGSGDAGLAVASVSAGVYVVGRVTAADGRVALRVTRYSSQTAAPAINVQGLWWQGTEPGWGVNLTHQGDVLFATWFTYDEQGQGLWLVMSNGVRVGDDSYAGTLYRTTGPAFNAVPFESTKVAASPVGSASFTFSDASNGTFRYTLNGSSGTKAITRQVFATPVPVCAQGAAASTLTNYQDLWWAPGGTESGWGLNVTHQGDVLFVTWFTYGPDGRGMWLVGSGLAKSGNATYAGTLYRTTGPPFSRQPWEASRVGVAAAGHAQLVFSGPDSGTFTYTLDGVTQSKPIARQVFASPKTTCY